ncbi:hypothetical protein J421_0295 [Gemmatirosa kalamazoonensis]|uniref:Uncharacterized protein n=1 Tax=Gemmatirosa kalamazoonensis TaxID=861299 RepID=W0RBK1_9BACT|nr:hypothetical protein [Gemmatirosa kalamazoonensis]AHG87832.1 hypothetical protein J421_0295 [Gemmatirosa kalamazoonensis]
MSKSYPTRAWLMAALVAAGAAGTTVGAAPAAAQSPAPHCRVLCAPSVTAMPGLLRTHLAHGPVVQSAGGAAHRLPSSSALELILAAAARTAIQRVSLFGSVQWLPNAGEARNPFTLYTANELGGHVHANAPTLTIGGSVSLLDASASRGLLDVAANVGDLFSQAARPRDRAAYTHKLDLDLVAHAHVFRAAPRYTYLHAASVFGILDYVATGLPKAGDEVPTGRHFVTDARPLALIVGLALPLAESQR